MYHMYEITDEKSLRTAISDYIGFYSEKDLKIDITVKHH